jgi:hypothetical protein
MGSLGCTMALESTQPLTERRPMRRADNLATVIFRLSWNMGASTSCNPHGLSRPVMGLLLPLFIGPVNNSNHECLHYATFSIPCQFLPVPVRLPTPLLNTPAISSDSDTKEHTKLRLRTVATKFLFWLLQCLHCLSERELSRHNSLL